MRLIPYIMFILIGLGIERLIGDDVGVAFILFACVATFIVQSTSNNSKQTKK